MKKYIAILTAALVLAFVGQAKAGVVYSSITPIISGYYAFAAGNGQLGLEDYIADTTSLGGGLGGPPADLVLNSMRFVGGVDTVGGTLDFTFFDAALTPVGGFAVTFASAGNFIYTITLPPGGLLPIKTNGFMAIDLDPTRPENAGVLGQWFIVEDPAGGAVSTGTSPQDMVMAGPGPNGGQFQWSFELDASATVSVIPEPTSFAIFGLVFVGGGFMRRRGRRRRSD